MKTNFAFKLDRLTDSGKIYTMDIIEPLDRFIKDSGLVFMYNDSNDFSSYSKKDFIGLATSYSINNDIITINFDIMEERFNSLKNISSLLSLPLSVGEEGENNTIKVKEIKAIVIML